MSIEYDTLEEMWAKTMLADSTHNIDVNLVKIEEAIKIENQRVATLYMLKGALLERLRTIKIVDEKMLHHDHIAPDSSQTTHALQNLHRVNAEEASHHSNH